MKENKVVIIGSGIAGMTAAIYLKRGGLEPIIIENSHEAIIDKDTFNYVQTLLPKNVKRPEKKRFYLFVN